MQPIVRAIATEAGLTISESEPIIADSAATLPIKPMGPDVDSRDAVAYHLAEAKHRNRVLRALLGIAKAKFITGGK